MTSWVQFVAPSARSISRFFQRHAAYVLVLPFVYLWGFWFQGACTLSVILASGGAVDMLRLLPGASAEEGMPWFYYSPPPGGDPLGWGTMLSAPLGGIVLAFVTVRLLRLAQPSARTRVASMLFYLMPAAALPATLVISWSPWPRGDFMWPLNGHYREAWLVVGAMLVAYGVGGWRTFQRHWGELGRGAYAVAFAVATCMPALGFALFRLVQAGPYWRQLLPACLQ